MRDVNAISCCMIGQNSGILTDFICLPNDKNCRLVQIESICRQQDRFDWKIEFFGGLESWVKNIVGNGEIAGNQYFLLFPTFFSKGFLCRVVKSWDCVVKSYLDNKRDVIEKLKLALERAKNMVGKGENAGNQHFLFYLPCFQKAFYTGSFKVRIV